MDGVFPCVHAQRIQKDMSANLAWDLLGAVAPGVAGRAALLGGGTVPHVPVVGVVPLASRQAHLITAASPTVLHRFGACEGKRVRQGEQYG